MFDLPKSSVVNKFIPKQTFYDKLNISSKAKKDFTSKVEKITWLYKLSRDTIGINKTEDVEEIQVFEIKLKEKDIPGPVLKIISKSVLYPILFAIKYNEEFCYGVVFEDIYLTKWNKSVQFNFTGHNLSIVYENIVKKIINKEDDNKNFEKIIQEHAYEEKLKKEIDKLERLIKKERQFNKKVELNTKLEILRNKLKNKKTKI